MLLQGILKGRLSGPVVPAAAWALPENSPTRAGWPQAAWFLSGFAEIVIESKLALLTTRQASTLGDDLLRQGITTLIKKLADQEDGSLKKPSPLSPNPGSFDRKGRGPLQCQLTTERDC